MADEIVDAHAHVWTSSEERRWVDPVMPPGVERMVYTEENYREEMETLGIDRAVLVATPIHGPGSPYTTAQVASNPEFYGIVLADQHATDIESHLEGIFGHERILGVRMTAEDLDAATAAYWEWLNQREKQVHLLLSPDELGAVREYVERYPGITFVVDHLGLYPAVGQRSPAERPYALVESLAEYDNVFVKVTHTPSEQPFPFEDIHGFVRILVDEFGSDRLLWGSDYIYHFKRVTPQQTREFLDELPFLSRRDRANLLGRTVDKLL